MVQRLLQHVSCFTRLPVEVDDIVEAVKERGLVDEINFYPVPDWNTGVVRGVFSRYERRDGVYGDSKSIVDIMYGANMPFHWIRLVCCKELMHIFDNGTHTASSRQAVSALISAMMTPLDLAKASGAVLNDHVTILWALALLFPRDARDLLMPAYNAGKLNSMDIAKLAQIPHRYVPHLMSDSWTRALNNVLLPAAA